MAGCREQSGACGSEIRCRSGLVLNLVGRAQSIRPSGSGHPCSVSQRSTIACELFRQHHGAINLRGSIAAMRRHRASLTRIPVGAYSACTQS